MLPAHGRRRRSRTARATGCALEHGALAVMAAADLGLGYAGAKVYAGFREGARFVVLLFRTDRPELVAVIDADKLGQLRTGAASAVAARHLARAGCVEPRRHRLRLAGGDAGGVHPRRAARDRARRRLLPDRGVAARVLRAQRRGGRREPRATRPTCDVVVTVTSSPDPVLRGEWLRPGALVCAVGANDGRRRELDNVVLERAAFVCCDSLEDARLESADLDRARRERRARLARGARAAGGRRGRAAGTAVATTTSSSSSRTGSPRGTSPPRPPSSRRLARAERSARGLDVLLAEGVDDVGPHEHSLLLLDAEAVLDVGVLEDRPRRASRSRARGGGTRPRPPPPSSSRRGTRTDCGRSSRSAASDAIVQSSRARFVRPRQVRGAGAPRGG